MKYFLLFLLFISIQMFAQTAPTLLWTEYYGGDYTDCFRSIIETTDGSILMGGYIKTTASGMYDLYLLKVDSAGQIEWELIYPDSTSNTDSERIEKIIPTQDGNFVALIHLFYWGDLDGTWLMKFDTDGNILWIQEYYGYCVAEDFVETDDAGFIILGRGDDNSIFDDFWLLRVDDMGNIVWEFENDPLITQLDWALVYSIINHDSEDSYIFNGYGNYSSFFCKINDDGEILWLECNDFGNGNKIIQIENEFAFGAAYYGELRIGKIDNFGNLIELTVVAIQDSVYGFTDFVYDADIGYVLLGTREFASGNNTRDVYISNLNNNGELVWQECYDFGMSQMGNSMFIYDEDYFYIGGVIYEGSHAFLAKFEFNNTSINEEIIQINNFGLQNYPNPFNPSTTISFSVAQTSSFVTIGIYNLKGQKVKILSPSLCYTEPFDKLRAGSVEVREKKQYSITWNGDDNNDNPVSSGIYLYKLNVNGKTEAMKKCLLLK